MSDTSASLEDRINEAVDIRERLMLVAELAWKTRQAEPERALEMAATIAGEAGTHSLPELEGIAAVIRLMIRMREEVSNAMLEEIARLEPVLETEPLWQARRFQLAGLCQAKLNRYESAVEFHVRALAIGETIGDRAGIAASLNNLGIAHFSLGDFPASGEYFRRAVAEYDELGNRLEVARSLNNIGAVSMHQGDRTEALATLEHAMAISEELDDRWNLARSLNDLGCLQLDLGNYPLALEHHGRALSIREALGEPLDIARSLNNIGNVYDALSDYQTALEYFRRSLAIKEEKGDPTGIANSLNNIGNILLSLGDSATALEHFGRSCEIWERIGNRSGEAAAAHNIGLVQYELGEYRMALESYRRSLAIEEEIGARGGVADSLNNVGNVYQALEESETAREHYQRALAIYEEIGDPTGIAACLTNISEVYHGLGDHDEALRHAQRSLALRKEMGDRAGMVEALVGVGTALLELGDPDRAIAELEEALAMANDIGARGILAEAHKGLVTAFERMERHREALAHLHEHMRITAEIRDEAARTELHRMEVRHRVAEAEKEAEIERLRNVELAEALRLLKETQTQLVQSEKMAGIGQLTAGIAHEINNPINYVSASLPSLERDLAELNDLFLPKPGYEAEAAEVIEEMQQLLRSTREGARRVSEIVAGLRSFSRLDENDLKAVDLHQGLDAALALLGSKIGGRIAIERSYGELPPIECYPGEINQIFMNLLSNAIDAIEGSGEISIITTIDNDMASIAITDTGIGIAPENIERIFDPFFTTKDIGHGTGLGLAICHGIITKHGGAITVESTPNLGSTFVISLPTSRRPAVPPSPTPPLSP